MNFSRPDGGGRLPSLAIVALLAAGLVVCVLIAQPFLPALVWAATLAVLASPLEARLRGRIGKPSISAGLTAALVAVAIIVPVLLISQALVGELMSGLDAAAHATSPFNWGLLAPRDPRLGRLIGWITENVAFEEVLRSLANWIAGWSSSVIQGSVMGVLTLLFTLYFLFYFLRDRRRIIEAASDILPLTDTEFARLCETARETIFASVYGTILVAALQGLLAGLMFWLLGLPSPVFWGSVMGLLAIVPFLGAFVVWVPAALMLAIDGRVGSALILAAWGLLVVGLIDNLIYPILVGRRLAMHSMLSFIAIVGGLILFGAHGLVLGPLCVAITLMLLAIARERRAAGAAERPAANGP